ncbi:MAG: AAA family ATPase [Nostoc sp. EfeVER01]|uniref:ATP-binding sensor histidine kinase n=1 Tax=unclassified Nostoc TaxID=2593658 RepID=UPI002AD54DC6|nr:MULTISPECIES: AAA family ATPase [unclassified Nostoc]MDZ7944761.1 AAA family ATPase [Nostoc sp. EfeVER01]MDZ7995880.1 AAA family ATPase [Nostoc sp. EspVER01]
MSAKIDGTLRIAGYQIIEQLYSGSRTQVYRAIRECVGAARRRHRLPVVIKLLKREYPTFTELVQFCNQYAIAKNLNIPGIIKPYSLEAHHNGYALVMEDFGGVSLRQFTQEKTLTLEQFLPIALQLLDILHQLHQQRVIHKDIKPANILIHPDTNQIKLIDFSIASLLPRETQEIQSLNRLEGTLAYLSPEQTGRMNRGIDYRSDFYSLGVTFFELLSGKLPFESHEPMELVHYHIAKLPPCLCDLNPKLPLMLGEIVRKLMAKNAEDRYQSALGIKHDLVICLEQWRETGKHTWFDLGQRDISDRFLIPEKLYGRESEVKTLLEAFGYVANGGSQLMLVAGFSGIGKTAVVNEVHKPIVRWNGYFIKGKYDQFNRNIPLSAFVQAFRDLIGQLLSESDTQLKQWQSQILAAVGENGQLLIEVIPELEQMIGKQPAIAELSGGAAQNRFNLLFQKFIQVFTTREHPLVIFLDDLQWADSASLNLLKLLMSQSDCGYLFIVGAYRDNEVFAAHPLMLTIDEIEKASSCVNTLSLAPLSQADVNHLIADSLSCATEKALPLTELVYQKAKGNPFFTTQFLKALHEDGLISFDWEVGFWQCDVAQVRLLALTDDVVEFMAQQLQKLPDITQNVLKLAACIGNQFDLATLAIVSEQSQIEAAASLWKALQEGLILPQSEVYKFYVGEEHQAVSPENSQIVVYKFLHDRVQQAAYSLIPSDEKQPIHLKIGQLLLNNTPESNQEERIFAIVSQLNVAAELIAQSAERQRLAQFNLMASRKAKAAAAYTAACKYAQVGIGLLAENSWQHQYELTLALHQVATEAAYLSGDLEQMAANARLVLNHAKTPLDQISVYEVKIEAFTAQGEFTQAIAAALAILKQLGVELPAAPTQEDVAAAFSTVSDAIGERLPGELLNLSQARDANILAAARILTSAAPCAYLFAPLLYLLVILKKVYLSVVYGNESTSTFSYVSYGILMCGVFGNVELGYEFGQLALDMLSRQQNSELKGKTLLLVFLYTRHWKMHLRDALHPLQMAYCSCLDVGDLAFAGYSAYNYGFYSYFAGQNLTQLEPEVAGYCKALKHLKQNTNLAYSQLIWQILLNLIGDADNVVVLSGAAYNEQHQLQLNEAGGDRTGLALLWINKLVVSYLFSEFQQAVEQAGQARQYLDAVLAFLYVPIFHFYESLAYLAYFGELSTPEQQQIKECIADNQEKLKYWATHAPMNFLHKFYLVEAEQERVQGNKASAIDLYDRAIALAKEHGYTQEEALANELAAKFYLNWRKEQIAQSYMTQAYYGYARWGAKAKVADLERRYPQLLAPILEQTRSPLSTNETIFTLGSLTSTSSATSDNSSVSVALDLATILKASQTLSGEIELEKLLSALLHIVIENAGADKCVFMLLESDRLLVQALAQLSLSGVQNQAAVNFYSMLLNPQPIEDSVDVPVGLINNIKRNLQPVVITDATVYPQLLNDAYIQQQQPKSILCSPVLHQGKLLGVLYLENNLATGAFTSDRVELLNLLCTQAAISLENARIYQNSQNYAQQLAQSLAKLQASELRFQNLANNIPGMVYQFRLEVDGSTSTPYVSSGCFDLYGLEPELVMSGTHSIYAMNHPDDRPAIAEAIAYSAQNLTPFEEEWRIILPSGTVKWIQSAARPELQADGAIIWDGVVIDISNGKQAEESLAKEREFLNAIIHNITDGIVVCDASGKLTLFNKATRDFHGLPVQSLPAEQWTEHFDLYQPDGQTPLSTTEIPLFRALQGEIVENAEMVIAPKHGSKRILLASGQAIFDSSGNKLGAVVVMRDISERARLEAERKQAELALQQKSLDLQQALNDLQNAQLQIVQSEKMSALGNLVAGVAHEMNNPLGFIAASLKQAKPTVADIVEHLKLYQESLPHKNDEIKNHAEEIDLDYSLEDLPKMIDSMSMACDRLKNISTSLRTFSRADQDYKVPFNIHQGIDSTILILKHRLKANDQRPAIEVVTNYGNLPQVECFPGQLNQVFMNIIANAIDALDESNVGHKFEEIQANINKIAIKTSIENNTIKIAIRDNGKGISEQVKNKIFDHLFTTKSVGKGTGLGLAIARQIVEETHNGKLSCNSILGEGTEFIIEIPV